MGAIKTANHFFAVVFDYDAQQAYSFGAFNGMESGVQCAVATESIWKRWYGPELWNDVAHSLGWESSLQPHDGIQVISKEWIQVASQCFRPTVH